MTSLQKRRIENLDKRRQKLKKLLKQEPETFIPLRLRNEVFGDYLQCDRLTPIKRYREVKKGIEAFRAFITVCQQQEQDNLLFFNLFSSDPTHYAENHANLMRIGGKRDRVFEQEWMRISGFLGRWDTMYLRRASPVFAMARHTRFRTVKRILDEAFAKSSLESIGSNDPMSNQIREVFKLRFIRLPKTQVFLDIFEEHKQKIQRTQDLQQELGRFGLYLRGDSRFCRQYIEGTTRASLEEVVSTMRITCFLFDTGGHRLWSVNRHTMETRLRELVFVNKYSWYDACAEVLLLPLTEPYYHDWEDDF